MPIIVDRRTGEVISKPEINQQQQRDLLWEVIIQNWIEKNPEAFRAMLSEEQDTESP